MRVPIRLPRYVEGDAVGRTAEAGRTAAIAARANFNSRAVLCRAQRPLLACAVIRRRFPVGASPTRQTLQPEATGAAMEVAKWLKPSDSVSRYPNIQFDFLGYAR